MYEQQRIREQMEWMEMQKMFPHILKSPELKQQVIRSALIRFYSVWNPLNPSPVTMNEIYRQRKNDGNTH